MKKQFVVIGLGRFGGNVSKTLTQMGYEVMGLDRDMRKVQEFAPILPHVYQADTTDENVLKELGVQNMDHAIVAIGDDLQASILTALILKDLGVPKVTAKAASEYHRRVLDRIGVDQVVQPEKDTGIRLAHQITNNNLVDYLELSPEMSLIELRAPRNMVNQTIKQLNVRARFGCNIVAIRRSDDSMLVSPLADDVINEGDILIVIGSNKDISRFEKRFEE